MSTFVIIGAGHAGGRAAETMRKCGFDGRIVLLGAEPHRPYERPPLSKGALLGTQDYASCFLQANEYYDEQSLDLRLGVTVTAIDSAAQTVLFTDAASVTYDRLLLTTGASCRTLSVPGAELAGVHYLRTMEDSLAIAGAVAERARTVVIGGGFIGLEVAACARQRGCEVTVLEAADRLLGRAVPAEIGARMARLHEAHGVTVRTGVHIEAIEGKEQVRAVRCDDGTVEADLVVIGIGIVPATGLAGDAGIAVDDGILVNEFCETSAEGVYAAGDATRFAHPLFERRLRLESWLHAEAQSAAAARVMCGDRQPYTQVPWLWSDQYDASLQVAGVIDAGDQCVRRGATDGDKATLFFSRNSLLTGVVGLGVGQPIGRDVRQARRLIESATAVDPAQLADETVDLKTLARPAT